MSVDGFVAIQQGSPELLVSVFYSAVSNRTEREKLLVEQLRRHWNFARGAKSSGTSSSVGGGGPRRDKKAEQGVFVFTVAQGEGKKEKEGEGNEQQQEEGREEEEEEEEEMFVVWHAANNVCQAVWTRRESLLNVQIASLFLQTFALLLAEHAKGGAMETYLVKPDEILVMLEKLLPCGQLLPLSTSLAKHCKKEADQVIMSK